MPRTARIVVLGVAHHVTQRDSGRQIVFYTRRDRQVYLELLKEHMVRAG
jgi:putative transposase